MSGINYRKGHERGAWFEVQCVREVIAGKEAKGKDASFERGLLRSWSKYEGYEDALKPVSQS